jgi:hypothetical protein
MNKTNVRSPRSLCKTPNQMGAFNEFRELFSPRDSLEGHLIKLKDDGHIENYKANDSIDWTSDDSLRDYC